VSIVLVLFSSEGIEAALELARAAAGDKDVGIWGGANIIQEYLKAGFGSKPTSNIRFPIKTPHTCGLKSPVRNFISSIRRHIFFRTVSKWHRGVRVGGEAGCSGHIL
jgi:hypothetical protein